MTLLLMGELDGGEDPHRPYSCAEGRRRPAGRPFTNVVGRFGTRKSPPCPPGLLASSCKPRVFRGQTEDLKKELKPAFTSYGGARGGGNPKAALTLRGRPAKAGRKAIYERSRPIWGS